MLTASDVIQKYISFFQKRGHQKIPNSPLVLANDPTTLFTSSGMQPLVPYLLGQEHPAGKRLVNVQNCFRAQDIEEVGDNRHTTFFRMLGNWSLGDYFKKEQLTWFWEFLTKELNLPEEKLYVSVFEGNDTVPKDTESFELWKSIGVKDDHIFFYGVEKNWWSRCGTPDKMPAGEIGGPDSEVFYEFTQIEHDKKFGETCHPNCDCGRFLEIGNSVFIQYQKQDNGSLNELSQKNVDFGGGLERLVAAINDSPDVFQTNIFTSIIEKICLGQEINYEQHRQTVQVIADHLKAAAFLIKGGVTPSNKMQGYVLRRLLRRVATKAFLINKEKSDSKFFNSVIKSVTDTERLDFNQSSAENVKKEVNIEIRKFRVTLEKGLRELQKIEHINGKRAFDFYQTYGFPWELIKELTERKGQKINAEEFQVEFEKHRDLSRTASAGMFRGGLADHSEKTIMGHTATHLLHQALRDVLGNQVHQTGSNITSERIRFDFNHDTKLTEEQIQDVEKIVNQKIVENLPIRYEMMTPGEADALGAIGLFKDTYADKVKIYMIGPSSGDSSGRSFSTEYCGGPHVDFTGVLKRFKIQKQENLGHGQKRIYARIQE